MKEHYTINSFNFAATGFYGAGKTTALEVAIDKIVENPAQFPNPKIVLVTWDDSKELKEMFEEKCQKIRDKNLPQFISSDCLQVLSLSEACYKYGVDSMPDQRIYSKDWFLQLVCSSYRTKPELINDLSLKLQGKLRLILTLHSLLSKL